MTPRPRRPTIKDLAAAVGVAPSTVSNAYNRPDQLSAALRSRILAEADRIGFAGPDPAARGLRTRTAGCVAVLLGAPLDAALADPALAATLAGVADALAPAGLALTLVPSPLPSGSAAAADVPPSPLGVVASLRGRHAGGEGASVPAPRSSPLAPPRCLPAADGLLSLCDDEADPLLALAARSSLPCVVVGAMPRRTEAGGGRKGDGTPSSVPSSPPPKAPKDVPHPPAPLRVAVDDTTAGHGAAAHLLALGHLRLAVLTTAGALPPSPRGRGAGGEGSGTALPVDRPLSSGRRGGGEGAFVLPPPALLPPPSSARTRARIQGYRLGVEAVGLAWGDVPLAAAPGDDPEAGRAVALRLLTATPRPTALLATSDRLAAGALAAARELGLAVPDALSVVGFDDGLAIATTPALTTVRQPHRAAGAAAARALLALLRGEAPPPLPRLPPKLVIRASTGPAPTDERSEEPR